MKSKYGIRFKRTPRCRIGFTGMPDLLVRILRRLIKIANEFGKDITITSGNDHKHRKGSRHYENLAVDIRIWNLTREERNMIVEFYKTSDSIIAIDEGNHIHIGKRRDK